MIWGRLLQERGGVAILMVLAFMALGVPIITSALGYADTLTTDSRVKTEILRRHYCTLGFMEYVRYLALEPQRWATWMDPDDGFGGTGTVEIDGCADTELAMVLVSGGPGDGPGLSFQELQISTKVVTPTAAAPGSPTDFEYTITLKNLGTDPITLQRVTDYLPPHMSFVGPTSGMTTTNPTIETNVGLTLCGDSPDQLTWELSPELELAPQESATLSFKANGALPEGIYYNKATLSYEPSWAPGTSVDIYTPYTAEITVGTGTAKCGFNLEILLRKKVSDVRVLAPGEMEVTYTISMENVTSTPIPVQRLVDLMPPGFIYLPGSSEGITTGDPVSFPASCLQPPDIAAMQRCLLTWGGGDLDPPIVVVAAGEELLQTIKATTKSDPTLAFYNQIRLVYQPPGFNPWASSTADVSIVLDNSGSIDGSELVLLKGAANEIVDGFSLSTTAGRIRIGVSRFNGSSVPMVDTTDLDIHDSGGIDPGTYYLNDGPGPGLPWTTVQGSDFEQESYTPSQGTDPLLDAEWEEVPEYWETLPIAADGVFPAASWTHRQWIGTEGSGNLWRWTVQLVRSNAVVESYTSSSGAVPPLVFGFVWLFDEIAQVTGDINVLAGDKFRLRLELWSDDPSLSDRRFEYRWGGGNWNSRSYNTVSLISSNTPLHDGINGLTLCNFCLTNIVAAITGGQAQFDTGLTDRPSVPNMMIVITDGDDTMTPENTYADIAAASADSNAEIFAVGVGTEAEVSPETLFAISFDPDNPGAVFDDANPDQYYSDHVFQATDFTDLIDIVNDIVAAVLGASQTVVTAEGGTATGGMLYEVTATLPDGTVITYQALVTSDGEVQILDWPG